MINPFKISVAAVLAASLLATPAYADKYVFYSDGHDYHKGQKYKNKHHRYDDNDRWGWRGRNYRSNYVRNVYVQQPYVQRAYYSEPTYSSVYCTNSYNPLGMLLGGAAGGVLGHQIGKGKGNTAATIGGAILGSAIGANALQQNCTEQVFQEVPLGTPVYWQSASNDEAYSFTPTRDYRTAGRYCREYQAASTVAGRRQQTYGTACMQPDGSWEVIN